MKKTLIYTILASGILTFSSCEQKEFLNPSAASETQVVNDVYGLVALSNGLAIPIQCRRRRGGLLHDFCQRTYYKRIACIKCR